LPPRKQAAMPWSCTPAPTPTPVPQSFAAT
jgi:hypothetical protein